MLSNHNSRLSAGWVVTLAFATFILAIFVVLPGYLANRFMPTAQAKLTEKAIVAHKQDELHAKGLTQDDFGPSRPFVGAVNGEAFKLVETEQGVENIKLKTVLPVFRAFGLSHDNSKILYISLKNGIPSGELFVEEFSTGTLSKISSRLVISAAWSPTNENKIAFTYSTGKGFGLSLFECDSGGTSTLVSENVLAEMIQWDDSGGGIHYFEADYSATRLILASRYVGASVMGNNNRNMLTVPSGFPVIKEHLKDGLGPQVFIETIDASPQNRYSFSALASDGEHEVNGDDLLGSGLLSSRHIPSGNVTALGEGQLLQVLTKGIVVRQFSGGTRLLFVDWEGHESTLGTMIVNYNLPMENSRMTQGGTGYAAHGNCNITAHFGGLAYAYDFQSTTVGAHVMASADGLVIFTTSSVVCNTLQANCPDYNPNGCPGTFLGNIVILQHADGTYSNYAHMETNSVQVAVGTSVCQGLYIGRQGHTGSTTGTFNNCGDHLHFQRQSSADIFGQSSVAIDFADVSANPLTCFNNYTSASTEVAHSVSPSSQAFGVPGGNGAVSVASTGCSWTTISPDSWITITSGGSGSGNDVVTYSVADNSDGGPRTGFITIAGHVVTISQEGGINGALDGTQTSPASSVSLTTEGTADWAHWGLTSASSFNRKNGVTQQISNYTMIGTGTVLRYASNPNSYSWTDGTPIATATNTVAGLYVIGLNNGFQVTVPADTTDRTLKLYVGVWAAGGRLEATLSDGSAPPYNDTSLVSQVTSNRVYTLNYRAITSGQTLTVRWTVNATSSAWGNVTLHAASLVNSSGPPTNQPPVVNAGNDQTVFQPNTASLAGTATDDGLPAPPAALTTTWSTVSGPGTVSFGNAAALSTTASFSTGGVYVLRLTANDSAIASSDDVTITVNSGVPGSLTGDSNSPASSVSLTTEGTADWAHWGLTSASSFNRKNGVTQQISNYTMIGTGTVLRYASNPNSYSWTDGTPIATATNTVAGLYVIGLNNGFQVTVPADTTDRTLKLYVGVWAAGGRLEATLSDGSAPPYNDTSLVSQVTSNRVYTLNYRAITSGQTLTVRWTVNATSSAWGNVTLHAASLVNSSGPPTNQPPVVNAGNDQTVFQPNTASLAGTATDDGLPAPPAALTTTWSTVSGPGTVSFGNAAALSTTASFSTGGVYVLRLTANDSAIASSDDVTITVNSGVPGSLTGDSNSPASSVSLTTEGTADWAHWGLTSASSFNRKNGVTQQISNYTMIGTGTVLRYASNPNSYSWTDGTPIATATNTVAGLYVIGLNNGFQVTVPADTTDRTLKLYVGVWAAGGRLEATLSDGSAPPYNDTSLVSQVTSNRVYTLNYRAITSGQTLTVRWTVNATSSAWGNVTLHAASLVNSSGPPTNQPPVVNAGNDQTVFQPNTASLAGTATDDGLPAPPAALTTTWSTVSGPGTVSFGNAAALSTTASFSTGGVYVLRLTANDSAIASSDDVTITVNSGVPGSLTGDSNSPASSVSLTTEGTADWAHWGLTSASSFNRKNGVTQQISNYTMIGTGTVLRYASNPNSYSWTDGTPIATATNTVAGLYVIGLNNGFQVTVPADTTDRTLKLYVGVWAAGGRLEATLSDGSAPPYNDTSLVSQVTSNRVYTLNYRAITSGQTLTVRWTVNATSSAWGNVTLHAASLVSAPPPLASEFQISSSAPFGQIVIHLAKDQNGNFVAVWQSDGGQDGSGWGIYARRYNAAGVPQGDEFQVNTLTAGNQFSPHVAMDANGNFVIVWESEGQDGNGYGISCQRYNAAGVPLGVETRVNTTVQNNQLDPFIAMAPTGNYVVAWTSDLQDGSLGGMFAQLFNASGIAQGGEFQVNTYTTNMQKQASASMDANGNFVIVWHSQDQDGSGLSCYGQRYNAVGVPQGSEFRANTTTVNDQYHPFVSMATNGDFVVVWTSASQDGDGMGVFGQRYNAAGVAQGGEFQVNTVIANDQQLGTVGMDPGGNFVVVWESEAQDSNGKGIYGRRYSALGVPQGGEFLVNTYTAGDQVFPFVARDATGNFVVTWSSIGQDGSGHGVFGKRFDAAGNPLDHP